MNDMKLSELVAKAYRKRQLKYVFICSILALIVIGLIYIGMTFGNTIYSPGVVWENLVGIRDDNKFTIVTLRFPRVLIGLLCGISFGIAGNTFQRIFQNPLASPDIIGVTSGAALGAMICMLVFKLNASITSIVALTFGMAVATIIYVISGGKGFQNGSLILIGIGMQAFLRAVISWILLKASSYDVGNALRWLSGSLNNMKIEYAYPLAIVLVIVLIFVFSMGKTVSVIQLGYELSSTLGARPIFSRTVLIFLTLLLTAFATAATGPIASISFLAGPIASRISSSGRNNMVSSALIGAILVLASDLVGQYAFAVKYPVGVITGILGAPYLLFLLFNMNKKGASA